MTDKTAWESFKVEGENVVDKIKSVIHEGNVRRVIVQHEGRTIAEFPLTAGVVGTGTGAGPGSGCRPCGPAQGLHDSHRACR